MNLSLPEKWLFYKRSRSKWRWIQVINATIPLLLMVLTKLRWGLDNRTFYWICCSIFFSAFYTCSFFVKSKLLFSGNIAWPVCSGSRSPPFPVTLPNRSLAACIIAMVAVAPILVTPNSWTAKRSSRECILPVAYLHTCS